MDIKETVEKLSNGELNLNEFTEENYKTFVDEFLAETYENRLEYLKLLVDKTDEKSFETTDTKYYAFFSLEENIKILRSEEIMG